MREVLRETGCFAVTDSVTGPVTAYFSGGSATVERIHHSVAALPLARGVTVIQREAPVSVLLFFMAPKNSWFV